MTEFAFTRRTLLALATHLAIAASAWGAIRWQELTDEKKQAILEMARRLYPHDTLDDDVYSAALAPLYDLATDDLSFGGSVRKILDKLDNLADGNWVAANAADQVAILKDIEASDFFATVQEAVRAELYNQPAVWALIGYPGSSVEHGGYIDRGFDDIDWLPDD